MCGVRALMFPRGQVCLCPAACSTVLLMCGLGSLAIVLILPSYMHDIYMHA